MGAVSRNGLRNSLDGRNSRDRQVSYEFADDSIHRSFLTLTISHTAIVNYDYFRYKPLLNLRWEPTTHHNG